MGVGEAADLAVVVVLELGRAPDQGLALGDDLALPRLVLFADMAVDAVHRVFDVGVEPRPERGALAVVARLLERCRAQRLQALRDRRRAVDRIGALLAIEGVGRAEQRLLLGRDEAVDQAFDAMVVDRRRGWHGLPGEPVGEDEFGAHARQFYARCDPSPIKGNGRCDSRARRALAGGPLPIMGDWTGTLSTGLRSDTGLDNGRRPRGGDRFPPSRSRC